MRKKIPAGTNISEWAEENKPYKDYQYVSHSYIDSSFGVRKVIIYYKTPNGRIINRKYNITK